MLQIRIVFYGEVGNLAFTICINQNLEDNLFPFILSKVVKIEGKLTSVPDYDIESSVKVLLGINDFNLDELEELPELKAKMTNVAKSVM